MNHKPWATGSRMPTLLYVTALLLLAGLGCLPLPSPVQAQAPPPARGLTPGQALPDLTLSSLVHHPQPSARLSDFRGKLLLLDFWATWCGNCKAAMPKLDLLQREFGSQVQVLLVNARSTRDTRPKVLAYFEKWRHPDGRPFQLPSVVEDTVLERLFPHQLIPHVVWVSPQGTVQAITSAEQVTPENIRRALQGQTDHLTRKKDVDLSRPLFTEPELPTRHLQHYSLLLQGQVEGLPSGSRLRRTPDGTVQGLALTNTPLATMYSLALRALAPALGEKGLRYEVRDSAALFPPAGRSPEEWLRAHAYSYDVVVPARQADSLFRRLLDDLNRYTPFRATFEARTLDCLVLVRKGRRDLLRSPGGPPENRLYATQGAGLRHLPLSALVARLNTEQGLPLVVDGTGYAGPVDLSLPPVSGDLPALREALRRYGLDLKPARRQVRLLVVRDQALPPSVSHAHP